MISGDDIDGMRDTPIDAASDHIDPDAYWRYQFEVAIKDNCARLQAQIDALHKIIDSNIEEIASLTYRLNNRKD